MSSAWFDIPLIFEKVKAALMLTDEQMADYLLINLPVVRAMRNGSDELPSHAVYDLLDTCGFIVGTDASMMILTKRAREKLKQARARRALTISQKNALKLLKSELEPSVGNQTAEGGRLAHS
jgi:hypothetical protein